MTGREIAQKLAALPLVGRLDAVQAAAGPQTTYELERAIEAMFGQVVQPPRRVHDETLAVGFGMPPMKAEGERIVLSTPFRFDEIGGSERELVRAAWLFVRKAAQGFDGEKLIWRVKPTFHTYRDFDTHMRTKRLTLRGHMITLVAP